MTMHHLAGCTRRLRRRLLLAFALSAAVAAVIADEGLQRTLSAGAFTLMRADANAYMEPAPVLTLAQHQQFLFGRNVFHRKWAAVVSLNGDWGLGPTFIATQCSQCHVRDGRGAPPQTRDEQLLSMLVRVSVPGVDEHGGPRPHPNYGDQIQNRALQGQSVDLAYGIEPIPAEADLYLEWQDAGVVTFADGGRVSLRKPRLIIEHLNFGELGADTMTSLRIAQPVFGLGLLDAVPEPAILALAKQQRAQGINGRPNYVWDAFAKRTVLGRYGWKANQPSLRQQIAAAALGDMGVSSNIFPDQNCPPVQVVCSRELPGNNPELADVELDATELWLRGLAVPARRDVDDPAVRLGEQLFTEAGCAACHVATLVTADQFAPLPQLAKQTFHAYTDLLLHDMGEGLADGRPDFQAGPRDWRTPPLWGMGLSRVVNGSEVLLHDGRARNAVEAILWHDGEARKSRDAFHAMAKSERDALVRFLNSI
jgi:CxxC motif-containing protein (DUF1111 family)